MRSESLVLRNSLWIGLQPLVLNVASIFVTGYIARTLGDEDYGKFVFAFALVAFFIPFGNLGLRAVTVRDIAANRDKGVTLLNKVLSLRIMLGMLAFALLIVAVNVMGYPASTKLIVYIAGITLLTKTAATTLFDVFQAYERMQYVAISNFISGTTLTIASVLVLVFGFRLVGLTVVYAGGGVLLLAVILLFFLREFDGVRLDFDRVFWRKSLKEGMPFFAVGIVTMLNIRLGIILLSKLGGDAAVGQYGAAANLIERLSIISESLCTAIFPALSALFVASKTDELRRVLSRYSHYLIMLGVPIAVGCTLLAPEIIGFIYGDEYAVSQRVLTVLSWNVPFVFFAALMGYCLGAIRRQPAVVRVALVATVVNVGVNLLLIPRLGALGVAYAALSVGIVSAAGTLLVVTQALSFRLSPSILAKTLLANAVLAGVVLACKPLYWAISIPVGAAAYFACLILVRAVNREDWRLVKSALTRRKLD